jgi:hypothetical protein
VKRGVFQVRDKIEQAIGNIEGISILIWSVHYFYLFYELPKICSTCYGPGISHAQNHVTPRLFDHNGDYFAGLHVYENVSTIHGNQGCWNGVNLLEKKMIVD